MAIGSNLPSRAVGAPEANCRAAIDRLRTAGLVPTAVSRFYETAPIPPSDQPWYVNVAVAVTTSRSPREALAVCLGIEAAMGRVRGVRNAARVVDIDIIAWDDRLIDEPDLAIPHPRLAERAFVLLPLADIAPDWHHPATGESISRLIEKLPPGQHIRPLPAGRGTDGRA